MTRCGINGLPAFGNAQFDHSQLKNIQLKNIAIFPSSYTTDISNGATLNWANVDFQVIGESRKRVWELKGSGTANSDNITIIYKVKTTYNIGFEGFVSGTITCQGFDTAMNATKYASISTTSGNNETTITLQIFGLGTLGRFGYTIYYNDFGWGCNGIDLQDCFDP
jgi:hypothetical protein